MKRKILCLIPARSGSKGVPGKNIKPLNGRPLIAYTFDAAEESQLIDKIVLNTDSARIAAHAANTSVEVPFIRPPHLAADHVSTLAVIKHTIDFFDNSDEHYDIICLLQPTCPFRNKGFVDKCIRAFISSGADSLFSAKKVPHEYNPHWVFAPDENGFLKIATGEDNIIPNRQMLPPAYIRDGSVYVFNADNVRHHNSIYGQHISFVESHCQWHINIDTEHDWAQAEAMAILQTS